MKSPSRSSNSYKLILRSIKNHNHRKIQISYAPKNVSGFKTKILPSWNHRSQYYTSAFIIPYLYKADRQSLQLQKQNFAKRIESHLQKKTQNEFFVEGPSQDICQICKTTYSNYNEHIRTRSHKAKMKKATGKNLIRSIVRIVRKIKRQEQNTAESIRALSRKKKITKN